MNNRPKRWRCYLITAAWLLGGALVSCSKASAPSASGKAGSMSRFALKGQHLYTLSPGTLRIYDLADPAAPRAVNKIVFRQTMETLFRHGDMLYVGARRGMVIFSLEHPETPRRVGEHRHVYSCDPVVVADTTAFLTLRSQAFCRRGRNELRVLDVSQPSRPRHLRTYPLTNPHGLGVDRGLLFVADGKAGLKVFDARHPQALRLLQTVPQLTAYDVIPHQGRLVVSAEDGLYQYDYSKLPLTELSRLPIASVAPIAPIAPGSAK